MNNANNSPNITVLVTGGAGFIGSALVRYLLTHTNYTIVNIDKLTYAGNLLSLQDVHDHPRHIFHKLDICNYQELKNIFDHYKPSGVFHLAAESHVDRSIACADAFIQTNIVGTYTLLKTSLEYFQGHKEQSRAAHATNFKFIHISTDEVFGSLGDSGYFSEETPYDPRSPYSATKASSDLLVRAWHHTYGLPAIITNCTNNYGPYHNPEKLIPRIITNALALQPLPIYGNGNNVRDWLYVEDHVAALVKVFQQGKIGESYCIGGNNEYSNKEVVQTICGLLDKFKPRVDGETYANLISYVVDRPGHDYRYAMNAAKIRTTLGYEAKYDFTRGIAKTIQWYLANEEWVTAIKEKSQI